jgi:hypothetical protein
MSCEHALEQKTTSYIVPRKLFVLCLFVFGIIACFRKKLDARELLKHIDVIMNTVSKGIQPTLSANMDETLTRLEFSVE